MCLVRHLLTSPPTPQKSYPQFQNSGITFLDPPLCPSKISIYSWGGVHRAQVSSNSEDVLQFAILYSKSSNFPFCPPKVLQKQNFCLLIFCPPKPPIRRFVLQNVLQFVVKNRCPLVPFLRVEILLRKKGKWG